MLARAALTSAVALLAACQSELRIDVASPADAKTILIVLKERGKSPERFLALDPADPEGPRPLLTPAAGTRVYQVLVPHSLEALQLEAGWQPRYEGSEGRRIFDLWPTIEATFDDLSSEPAWTDLSTVTDTLAELAAPPIDWFACHQGGGCVADHGVHDHCELDCMPAAPIPPALPECPTGWTRVTLDDGGITCTEDDPIPQIDCLDDHYQFYGDRHCTQIPPDNCPPPAEDWAVGLPTTGVVYVKENATNGDGTRARPFGEISAALDSLTGSATIALSRGDFGGHLTIDRPDVSLVGACAYETRLVQGPMADPTVTVRAPRFTFREIEMPQGYRQIWLDGGEASAWVRESKIHGESYGISGHGARLTVRQTAFVGGRSAVEAFPETAGYGVLKVMESAFIGTEGAISGPMRGGHSELARIYARGVSGFRAMFFSGTGTVDVSGLSVSDCEGYLLATTGPFGLKLSQLDLRWTGPIRIHRSGLAVITEVRVQGPHRGALQIESSPAVTVEDYSILSPGTCSDDACEAMISARDSGLTVRRAFVVPGEHIAVASANSVVAGQDIIIGNERLASEQCRFRDAAAWSTTRGSRDKISRAAFHCTPTGLLTANAVLTAEDISLVAIAHTGLWLGNDARVNATRVELIRSFGSGIRSTGGPNSLASSDLRVGRHGTENATASVALDLGTSEEVRVERFAVTGTTAIRLVLRPIRFAFVDGLVSGARTGISLSGPEPFRLRDALVRVRFEEVDRSAAHTD